MAKNHFLNVHGSTVPNETCTRFNRAERSEPCSTVHFDYHFQPNRAARFTSLGFKRVMIRKCLFYLDYSCSRFGILKKHQF